ncbi:MAG: hypothetical protein HZA36_00480 [Parcubacteria group bacterium]|nr:hypothetical protein [Parcubacteria group bacterium]
MPKGVATKKEREGEGMMTLPKKCLPKEDIIVALEQLLREMDHKRIKFDHKEDTRGHIFSTIFQAKNIPITIRLIRKNDKEFVLECICTCHGRYQYDLCEKRVRGAAGTLYDYLFLQWKGILPN